MSKFLPLLLIFFILCSCVSKKKMVYFRGNFKKNVATPIPQKKFQYTVQPNDVLSIKLQSLDPATAEYFNLNSNIAGNFQNNAASLFLQGYSVNDSGYVNLPLVGLVQVSGLTIDQTQSLIQQEVDKHLKKATIIVKLISFKISVLGEVNEPGYYYVYNNQATIVEGLALAGDLTTYGNRKNVKLIRHTQEGMSVVVLDLRDPGLLQSEYYYLLPNDEIYVEPVRAKAFKTNSTPISLIFGGISTVLLILNFAVQ